MTTSDKNTDENGTHYLPLGTGPEAFRDSGLLYLLNEHVLHGQGFEARVGGEGELLLYGDGRQLIQWPTDLLEAVDGRRTAARQTLLDAGQYNYPGYYDGHSPGFPAVLPRQGGPEVDQK